MLKKVGHNLTCFWHNLMTPGWIWIYIYIYTQLTLLSDIPSGNLKERAKNEGVETLMQ